MLNLKINTHQLRRTWLGHCVYYCFPKKKSVAYKNIEHVFQDHLTLGERKQLLISFYSHLITSIKEIFLLRLLSDKSLKSRVEVRGVEHFFAAAEKGRGVLLLTGHFGNWEFGPLLGVSSTKEYQEKIHVIRKNLRFNWIEKILFRQNYARNINIIMVNGALKKIRSVFRNNDVVLFFMDQKAKKNQKTHVSSTFLGQRVESYTSMAHLVKKYECVVMPMTSYRIDNTNHILEFFKEIPWEDHTDPKEAIVKNTLNYIEVLEHMLLAHPEQWIWNYKRWVLKV